ncbi:MBL fold metallo-hydrolase RNA specificity domain-containing protein [Neomoorella humiferrea]|uniref:Ribonuclease n=1 Tax=Neomoorella humiferrea TaxID=676965 RepID=A0A2T0AY24_9FIRM|nr:MBL fold metallo-hydrolase [Moorella humiferrea]PRR75575.1 Ribonuclease [Moorella humiferrea]
MINLHFYGAAGTVTGSCYLLDNGHYRILIDRGLFQGSKAIKERNYGPFPFNPATIDALVLTHAHIDHCGLIPKLYLGGFKGPVFATPATIELAAALLPDSGHIQEMEVERKNRKNSRAGLPLLTPIYTAAQAAECLQFFQSLDYQNEKEILPGFRLRFQDAGHILGSAIAELWVKDGAEEIKITFSGDLGNPGQPIVKDPTPIESTDYLIMESTYGNRRHNTQGDKIELLKEIINKTMKKGGNLVIPAFAVERTQDLLYYLNILLNQKAINVDNIYLDSPLAAAATDIFCRHQEYFDAETKELSKDGACPLFLPGLKISRTAEESMAINKIKGGAIIIAASGMCDAGRIKHHLKHNLWRPECTVLLVGYQAAGTLGRRLLEGEKRVRIHGEEIAVRADIISLDGFSAHADRDGLLKWLKSCGSPPKKVFVTHGEEEAARDFAALVTAELGVPAEAPQWLATARLLPAKATLSSVLPEAPAAQVAAAVEAEAVYQRILVQLKAMVDAGFANHDYGGVQRKLQQIAALLNHQI